ncbi:MAG: hypothetical protein N2319_08600 [Candidatus Kapabacteria bacterium]|nr:hypothetical protein [Candidatus Kapabacteria bacterium]
MYNKRFDLTSKALFASIIVLIIFGLSFNSLEAKRKGYSKGDGTGRITELKEKLNLTDDQVSKLTPIMKNHNSQVKAIREKYKDAGPDERQKMRDEIKVVFDKTYAEAGKILSTEQLTKFKEIIKHNQNTGGSKGKGQGQGQGSGNRYRNKN